MNATTLKVVSKYVNKKLKLISSYFADIFMPNDLAHQQFSRHALHDLLAIDNHHTSESLNIRMALDTLARGDFEEKWAAVKILVKHGDKIILPLEEVILDENAYLEHRCFALRALKQLKNPAIILIMSELLMQTQEEELIALATQTLAVQGKEAIAFLGKLLPDQRYRLLATKALSQIPSQQVIEPLLTVVEDETNEIRVAAICALRNFNHPQVIQALIKALQDYTAQVRKEALVGLGLKLKSQSDTTLIDAITPLIGDLNLSVAQQAAMSLNRCRHPHAICALEKVLLADTTPVPLQMTIVRVLAWIATKESIQAMKQLINHPNPQLTLEMVKVLGRINRAEVRADIMALLKDLYHRQTNWQQQPEILQALCYSWTQLLATEVLPILKQIELSNHAQVRFHAQSAIDTLVKLV